MADRSNASTHRKVISHLNTQQQRRARQLVALVPKPGAKSDLDESDTSEDEVQYFSHLPYSDSSSPPPSLPSSLENLNLLSDDDIEVTEIFASKSLVQAYSQHSIQSPLINPCSPSILSPYPLATETRSSCPIPSPSSPSVLAAPSQLTSPRVSNLKRHHQSPPTSPLFANFPSTSTCSKRPKLVTVKRKAIPPKRLTPKWGRFKFTGCAEVDEIVFEPSEEKSPIEYFGMFFSDNIISLIVQQTNLYSTQLKGHSINVTENDIKDFLAILVYMGIHKLPAYTDYWAKHTRSNKVADIMTLKKFQLLRRHLHFNDNLKDDGDRYYKLRPVLQIIRENCLKVKEESHFSIDEMIVPHKGTRAGSRKQYIKNKPKKWGYKVFVRAGGSGIVYDFLIYGGEDTFRFHSFTDEEMSMGLGSKVVLALAKSIGEPACLLVFR
ncbi:piggyBac transposable element-derived protein 3-like [Colias croceus]|uniref:piggyBac transposable element-derived protein 3-like n=1 Tax=Colias crocea TaxID=72248 RepID=UPI001E280429|nr:piggyBac transposable element-derived protein 3-like [Colias croceus]